MNRSAEVHDLPLANRLVDALIGEFIAEGAGIARCGGMANDFERGFRQGVDEMQHLHLSGYRYRLTPHILDALRRAGLLRERAA